MISVNCDLLNVSKTDHLLTSSFARLGVADLYAIRLHLKSCWTREYFVRHGDDSIDNVGVWVTSTLRS